MKVVPPSPIPFQKIKLRKKDMLSIGLARIEKDGTITEVGEDHKSPCHPDLKGKLNSLRIHLALLCDYLSTRHIKDIGSYDPALIETFTVTGVSLGGGEDDEGVVITGYKTTKRKNVVILNSPFTRFEEVEETKYRYVDDLRNKIDELEEEARLYLSGKRGEVIPEFEFPEDEFTDEAVDVADEVIQIDVKIPAQLEDKPKVKKAAKKK